LEAIAVEADERSPLLPDVPTLRELGYKGDLTRVYFGFVAPAGTPQPVIDKISAEINRINKIPEFRQKRMIDLALEPVADTPAEFAAFLTKDREKSREIVKESGLPKR
jgi:tripartite-type tricarboxylate transporter receptor subunit TctC